MEPVAGEYLMVVNFSVTQQISYKCKIVNFITWTRSAQIQIYRFKTF